MMICVLGVADACWLGSECGYDLGSGRERRKKVVSTGTGTVGLVESAVSSSFLCRGRAEVSDG
jgi:hypothetical protein